MGIRTTLLLSLTLSFSSTLTAQQRSTQATQTREASPTVYQVKQDDGSILYTDTPVKNAAPVTFSSHTNNVVGIDVPPAPLVAASKNKKPSLATYAVNITSPAPQATIRNNSGKVTIRATQPKKPFAPRYQLQLNGNVYAANTTGVFSLEGLPRGAHDYQVQLIDNKGKTLASSEVRTLFLHQASVLINNN